MAGTQRAARDATAAPPAKEKPSFGTAAAALFDPDVRDVLAILERARRSTVRPS